MWVSATDIVNFLQGETLVDWLNLYGAERGFVPDNARSSYDETTDMAIFLRDKGGEFEDAVVRVLKERGFQYVEIPRWSSELPPRDLQARTLEAMRAGSDVIVQGTLIDEDRETYGRPDLLVRSDVLGRLTAIPALTEDEAVINAPRLGVGKWHYRVVDMKFSRLTLGAKDGLVRGGGSMPSRQGQLMVYNRALGQLQGFTPPVAYLLGRSWEQTVKGVTTRGNGCLDRLGPVNMEDESLATEVDEAVAWVRQVQEEGAGWQVLPSPSRPELRPNGSSRYDFPWHQAKNEIAEALRDPILLWMVGADKRDRAIEAGIQSIDDPAACAAAFGVTGEKQGRILDEIIRMRQATDSPLVWPERIETERELWGDEQSVEFFVDFETVGNTDDNFQGMPGMGGTPLIFMIGCGHLEQGEWKFRCFIADTLNEVHEAEIIDAWIGHMSEVQSRLAPGTARPLCFHWSPAEDASFLTQYNSACARHPDRHWPQPNWFDFLNRVIRKEPVLVKGALSFGLKPLARAMFSHGLISTEWTEGPGDGLQAMVGAWRCHRQALEQGVPMRSLEMMKGIEKYNEVDCKVMQEIIFYLRRNR